LMVGRVTIPWMGVMTSTSVSVVQPQLPESR
jgi:hypothetical protein